MMEMEHGFWEKSKYCTTTDAEKDSQSRLRELQGVMLNKDWIKLKRNYALKREIMEEQEWRALHVVVLNNAKKRNCSIRQELEEERTVNARMINKTAHGIERKTQPPLLTEEGSLRKDYTHVSGYETNKLS